MFGRNGRSAQFNPTILSTNHSTSFYVSHASNGMDEENCAKDYTPEPMAKKCPRSSPTFHTPHREPKRTPFRQKMQEENFPRPRVLLQSFFLPNQGSDKQEKWSDAKLTALIEFVLFHSKGDSWPSHKREVFWNSAGEFVQTRAGGSVGRSGRWCTICPVDP